MKRYLRTSPHIISLAVISCLFIGNATAGDVVKHIVGGEPAKVGELPWMASIGYSNPEENIQFDHLCGATIIDDYWAITAAHCAVPFLSGALDHIKLRSNFLTHDSDDGNGNSVIETIIHPDYEIDDGNGNSMIETIIHPDYEIFVKEYDVALLRLGEPSSTQYIKLAPSGTVSFMPSGTMLTTAGWGDLKEGEPTLPALQKVNVPYVTNLVCNLPQSYDGKVKETQMCAGYAKGGKDACQNDSGGPLVIYDDGVPLQVGIVSWGVGCAREDKYGVYENLTHPKNSHWIEKVMSSY